MSQERTIRPRARAVAGVLLAFGLFASFLVATSPADAGGGCRGMPVTSGETTAVEIGDAPCFEPTVISVDRGDTVTWTNSGSLPHTVTGANASWGDYSELLNGQSVSHTFDAVGSYPYYCLLHSGMVGGVVVTDGAGAVGAESAVLASGNLGQSLARTAPSNAGDGRNNALTMMIVTLAVVAVVLTGSCGFVLGRRRS